MPECTPTPEGCKTCWQCGEVKPLIDYYKGKARCKPCHLDSRREYNKQWYQDNQEHHKQLRDRWRAENPRYLGEYYRRNRDRIVASAVEYAKRNPPDPERHRRNARARYAADRERASAVKRAWQESNPEVVAESRRRAASRRRARKRALPAEIYTLAQIIDRDGTLCVLCGAELDLSAKWPDPKAATVEHLECLAWPDSAGDVLNNVAASHFRCNAERNIRPHPAAARKRAELIRMREVG